MIIQSQPIIYSPDLAARLLFTIYFCWWHGVDFGADSCSLGFSTREAANVFAIVGRDGAGLQLVVFAVFSFL
jgi:hypothetical protein